MFRIAHWQARPQLLVSVLVGVAVALFTPRLEAIGSRGLLGWTVGVWLYLGLVGARMLHADPDRLRRVAKAQADGAATVLAVVVVAALVSLFGVVAELSAVKEPGAPNKLAHVLFALATVTGSWLLIPTKFALTYASHFFSVGEGAGLRFPDSDADFAPDFADFVYFSFTIAVALQTADVVICSRPMRRLVLLQSVLSFAFNTAILAFTVNVAASLF